MKCLKAFEMWTVSWNPLKQKKEYVKNYQQKVTENMKPENKCKSAKKYITLAHCL